MADMAQPPILSVSDLNRLARELLERSFPLFWVAGEISNLTRAASGHWYFSLKDAHAQVRCVMFRNRNLAVDWQPREGDHVEARALVTLYETRGDFQLTIESMQRAGLGALFEAFERLKAKLEREGLFDPARKRPVTTLKRQIGIVTSPDAAALRDVLTTLKRRMPGIPVVIYPTPVQGKGAANLIAQAIRIAGERAECEVLIVCRGGGSMEDLWQFNEEIVARAIADCPIPVISGVGHETDFTIADFVADVRAPTPTAAAELVSPDRAALMQKLRQLQQRMLRQSSNGLAQRAQQLDYLSRRLLSPLQQITHRKVHLAQIGLRLQNAMTQHLANTSARLGRLNQNLAHLNPHAVLERGYALAQTDDGEIVRSATQLHPGQALHLRLSEGQAETRVIKTSR
jgi:exodeoxyribonuclease VII large subunit